jgi:anaerobic ribonucleoside-triphosphate reductase activating protein
MNQDTERIDTTFLNLANMVEKTTALGPGMRAAIWVQGCHLRCRGCISPDWIPFKPAIQLTPQQVIERLPLDEITGLTLSGGEPMEQAGALAQVVQLARQRHNLNVICFTGYRYETLLKRPPESEVHKLVQLVDVLIDGPFVQALNNSLGLRGSTNQRVIHLTDRLSGYQLDDQARQVEFKVEDGSFTMVGIPTPGIASVLTEMFQTDADWRAEYERP